LTEQVQAILDELAMLDSVIATGEQTQAELPEDVGVELMLLGLHNRRERTRAELADALQATPEAEAAAPREG
jgi:hypothetical protein